MATITELQARFTASANGFLSEFRTVEAAIGNLPKITEKATKKMNDSFDKVDGSIDKLDKSLAGAGDKFDMSKVKKGLTEAQKEFKETGEVSKATLNNLNKEIKSVDFKSLPRDAQRAMTEINNSVKSVERQMNKIGDVKFLEGLPEDARKAGAELLELEKDVNRTKKALGGLDTGADFSNLNKGLDKAKNELRETGRVSDATMKGISADVKAVDFNNFSVAANTAFGKVETRAQKLEQTLEGVGKDLNGTQMTKGLNKGIDDATGSVGGLKGAIKGVGPLLAASLSGAAVVGFTKQIIDSTAEIKALSSQYEQVMGKMKSDTDVYLGEMSKKYNVHPNELKKSMLQYQAILKSKGLSEEDAYKTSKKWLERTVDGSSFANESIEQSTARMMGIIKGEYDSADTVMINLSQTMLNDIAVDKYGKKWEKLSVTQQENIKIQESLRQHNKAGVFGQGIKEADSYEKNLAMLKSTWTDFLASYGGPALAVANKGLKGAVGLIRSMENGFKTIGRLIDGLKQGKPVNILTKLGFSNGAANSIINWFNTLQRTLSIAGGRVKGFFQLFKGNGTEGVISLTKLGLSPDKIKTLTTVADGIKNAFKSAFGAIGKFAKDGLSSIVRFFQTDGAQILQAARNIGNVIHTVFKGILAVMKFVWPAVRMIIVSVWGNITGVIKGAMQTIKGIIQVFSGLFTGDFRKMWQGIKNIFFGAVKLIWNGVQLLFYGKLLKGALGFAKLFAGGLKSMWTKIVGFFKTFGASIYRGITNNFSSMYKGVNRIFGNLVKWLLNATRGLVRNVVNFFKSLGSNILKIITSMKNGLSKTWGLIKTLSINAAKAIKDKVWGFFSSMWKNISGLMSRMKSGLSKTWTSIKDTALNAGKNLKQGFLNHITNLKKGVETLVGNIKKSVIGMKDSVVDSAKALAKGLKDHAIGGLNLMIKGINWVADKIGIDTKISPIKYSEGTDDKPKPRPYNSGGGHPGGLATVADKGPGNGKGVRELVQFPNGRTALFEKETTFDMPPGTHVWSNKETEPILEAMKYSTGTNGAGAKQKGNNASGKEPSAAAKAMGWLGATAFTNSSKVFGADNTAKALKATAKAGAKVEKFAGDVMEYASNPGKLLNIAMNKFGVDFGNFGGFTGDLLDYGVGKLKKGATDLISQWFAQAMESSGGSGDGGVLDISKLSYKYGHTAAYTNETGVYWHDGVDFNYIFEKVGATHDGIARVPAPMPGGYGNWIKIVQGALEVIYGHMSKIFVKDGQRVKVGQALGVTGNTGFSTGPHLHYELRKNGKSFDPEPFLRGQAKALGGSIKGGIVGKGSWAQKIRQAAAQMKVAVTDSQVNGILAQMQRESGFNENIVQSSAVWDVNMANGNPAQGVLQYIPQTFRAFAVPGYNNIRNGYHQLLAFFNNSNWANDIQYGKSGWGPRGTRRFANGGFTKGESYIAGEEYEEAIIPMDPKRKARANQLLAEANYKVNGPVKYANGTPKTHKVKWGDTLWDISRKNGTTVKFLQALNGIKDHLIYPGQIIKLTKTISDLGKNVKTHAKAVTKEPVYTTVKRSRTDVLLAEANRLLDKGINNPESKTSKDDIAIGKLMISKMKNVATQSLNSLYTNVKSIVAKLDSVIKSSTAKIKTGSSKVVSLSDKNRDAQYKIEALMAERRLGGKTGTIAVKTRLKDADTTKVDAQIKTAKTSKANADKKVADLQKKLIKARSDMAKAKTSKEKTRTKKEYADTLRQLNAYKTVQKTAAKALDAHNKHRTSLLNRFKVTEKKVKGRSSATIDKEIAKYKKTIADNKKLITASKSEMNVYKQQIANLNQLKKNEVLKRDFLKKLYDKRAELLKQMTALKEKEKTLNEEKTSFKSSVNENLQGYAGFGAAKGNTARDFVEFMKYRLNRVRKFSANLTKLKGMGLDPVIMQEMIAGGIESAMPRAEVLIAGGRGYISQINALQAEVNKALEWVSNKQADNVFDPQIAQVKADIKKNTSEQNKLNTQSREYMTKKQAVKVAKPSTTTSTAKKTTTKKPSTKKPTSKIHNIKWGDTLSGIAAKYKTTVAKIKAANGLKSDLIIAGKTLKIPGYATGGIVNTPQLAWIAEGGFAESIISHDPKRRVQQERIWKETGDTLGFTSGDTEMLERIYGVLGDILDANRNYSDKPINVNLNAREVGKSTAPYVDEELAKRQQLNKRGLARNVR